MNPRETAPPAGAAAGAVASVALFTARAILDELVRGGVRTFCIAPGSRSTALALAVAERVELRGLPRPQPADPAQAPAHALQAPALAAHVLTDERSMGFFALGIARATAGTVAVICTSGTAAANLLPAVVESALGGGGLVLLTADRPPELRDCAAPQTIDQVGLFGSHARWSVDVPLLDATTGSARVLRSIAARAAATALAGRGGPVHMNVPLREPFSDPTFPMRAGFDVAARADGRPFTAPAGDWSLSQDEVAAIAARLSRAERGVLVCAGPGLPAASIAALAASLGWPVLADPMSGLRFGRHDLAAVVDAGEPLLRDDALRAALRPDCVVRFGLTPAPRSVQRWLDDAWPAEHIVVTGDPFAWPDPMRAASTMVRAAPAAFCDALVDALAPGPTDRARQEPRQLPAPTPWLERWQRVSALARHTLDAGLDAEPVLFDAIVLRRLVAALPDGAGLVVGNSMPVRDADAFLAKGDKPLRVFANRGASGIDGVLSTALGIAAASSPRPTALVVGDLSFLHDAAALAFAARERIPLLVVVVNNDGGAIFSFLPLRDALASAAANGPEDSADFGGEVFERYFGTPHGTDLQRVASVSGGWFARVDGRDALDAALAEGLAAAANGPAVIEVRTDRDAGLRAHRTIVAAAQAAVAGLLPALPSHAARETDPTGLDAANHARRDVPSDIPTTTLPSQRNIA